MGPSFPRNLFAGFSAFPRNLFAEISVFPRNLFAIYSGLLCSALFFPYQVINFYPDDFSEDGTWLFLLLFLLFRLNFLLNFLMLNSRRCKTYLTRNTNGCLQRCENISVRSMACWSKNTEGFRSDTRNMMAVIWDIMPSGSSASSLP